MDEVISFEEFCTLYKELLFGNGLSMHLLRTLHRKLEHEIFDAGDYFMLTPDQEGDGKLKVVASLEDGLEVSDPNSVFLIDHAWTYRACDARKHLCESPGLLPRIAEMMGYSVHGEVFNPDDDIVENVMKEMWKYNQSYSVDNGVSERKVPLPVWYVMDEFGSNIQHSDSPTVAMVPFFYQPKQTSFSLMWPLIDLDYGDEVTRDYANYEKDEIIRKCKLLPWFPQDMTNISRVTGLFSDKSYEDRYAYAKEILPNVSPPADILEKKRLKVYIDANKELLTDVATFEIVEDESEADIVFTGEHVRDFKKLSEETPHLYVNQFPCDKLLSCKDFFADIAKRSTVNHREPPWCPVTYDLYSQFPEFVSYFQKRSTMKSDENCWIIKPWSLNRGLDVSVSNNLDEIIRLREMGSPKVVSKYIEKPVLINYPESEMAVKFHLRYNVLVTSMRPLKLHACEIFLPCLASRPYSLDMLDDVESHFTFRLDAGRNYVTPCMFYSDFVKDFEKQYTDYKWSDITNRIHKCLSEFMKAAVSRPPPYGVGQYSHSRAIYGFDVMLEWKTDESTGDVTMQPVLLECNFVPDLRRICKMVPTFLNDAFKFLFLGDENCQVVDISDL